MRIGSTFNLVLLLAVLLGALWIVREYDQRRQRAGEQAGGLLGVPTEDITAFSVATSNGTVRLVSHSGVWFLAEPMCARADQAAVQRELDRLHHLTTVLTIDAADQAGRALGPAQYGLAEPRARLVVQTATLTNRYAVGFPVALREAVYLRVNDSADIVAVEGELDELVAIDAATVRNRALFAPSQKRVARLDIERGDAPFIQLARRDGEWWMQQPRVGRGDEDVIEMLVEGLLGATIQDFFWDPAGDAIAPTLSAVAPTRAMAAVPRAVLETCGLDDSLQARLTIWHEGDALGQEVVLGRKVEGADNRIYAMLGGIPAVYEIDGAIFDALPELASDLRDRRLFPVTVDAVQQIEIDGPDRKLVIRRDVGKGWRIIDPVQWAADPLLVRAFIAGAVGSTGLRFHEQGALTGLVANASDPDYRVALEVLREGGEGEDARQTYSYRIWLPGETSPGVGHLLDAAELQELDGRQLAWLGFMQLDPLAFRDRTMLALVPDDIQRIDSRLAGVERTVTLDADGAWSTAQTNQVANIDAVNGILFAVCNLRAERIVARGVGRLPDFGLTDTADTLSFGLRGVGSSQRVLLLGSYAEDGYRHAAVRGEDVVFLLSGSDVKRLTAEVVTAPTGVGDAGL